MRLLRAFASLTVFGILLGSPSESVLAAMSSSNYEIKWDSVSVGGDDISASATYQLRDSIGDQSAGDNSSATYQNTSGYRQGIFDQIATFELFIQYRNSQVAATVLSGDVVSVTSIVGYSVGDMIIVVQNDGDSQTSALGRIESILGTDITLDFLTDSGSVPSVDGSNDYVYKMSGGSLSFGSLTSNDIVTGVIGWEVNADISDGYHVYVYQDHDLRLESDITEIIDGVTDGDVSSGVEYGARSSDSSLSLSTFDSEDTAFADELQEVGSKDDNSFTSRDYLTSRINVNSLVEDGTYSHTLTFVYVGDY